MPGSETNRRRILGFWQELRRRYGCDFSDATLDAVLKKECEEFKVDQDGATLRTLSDHELIDNDDLLLSEGLKHPNNDLLLFPKGRNFDGTQETVDDILETIESKVEELKTYYQSGLQIAVRKMLDEHRSLSPSNSVALAGIQAMVTCRAHNRHRDEHPEWFKDIKSDVKTKEEWIRKRYLQKMWSSAFAELSLPEDKDILDWELSNMVDDILETIESKAEELKTYFQSGMQIAVGKVLDERRCLSPSNSVALAGIQTVVTCNAHFSSRAEHPDWFLHLKDSVKTKEAWMRQSGHRRLSNYLPNISSRAFKKLSPREEHILEQALSKIKTRFEEEMTGRGYFDRSDKVHRFCDDEGYFHCQGAYNKESCIRKTSINPYSSYTQLKDFSKNWELDHCIEQKSIKAGLAQAAKDVEEARQQGNNLLDINVDYFFSLIFTKDNLKLVEHACHKNNHTGMSCDLSMITVVTGLVELPYFGSPIP
ncbi:DNA fragmentation factor subunit beta-like isoform X2 [Sycon ciliatum]|uniref:DNA fragmentation factor subunit beta-like isoform X2 n=1 Tax=Sycon ciliatum TaxID=27933 RepID=UPI0031F5FD21